MTARMYQGITVYRRLGANQIVMYRCFRLLPNGGYMVQSADRIHLPFNDEDIRQHDAQFCELFSEQDPEERSGAFTTLEEAITAFDKEFDD